MVNIKEYRGAWVARSVKRPTLGFGSGLDLAVRGFEPCVGLCADGTGPAWDSLSLLLPHSCCVSLKTKKLKKKLEKEYNVVQN